MSREPLKLLFVCSENKHRSRICEEVYRTKPGFEAKSAGTWSSAVRPLEKRDLEWADLVLPMEENHSSDILKDFPEWWQAQSQKVELLGIKDEYFTDEELEKLKPICEEKVTQVLRKRNLL